MYICFMRPPKDIERYGSYYDADLFWKKLGAKAKKLGAKLVYHALVLFYALQSPSLTSKEKALVLGALGYFILPLDLLPDFIPALGYSDDLAALVFAVYKVAKSITPEVHRQAHMKVLQWFGPIADDDVHIADTDVHIDEQ